jgi:hypothetical protein
MFSNKLSPPGKLSRRRTPGKAIEAMKKAKK